VQVSAEWFLERIRGKPYQYWVFGWLCKNERHRAKIEKMIKKALLYQLSYAPTITECTTIKSSYCNGDNMVSDPISRVGGCFGGCCFRRIRRSKQGKPLDRRQVVLGSQVCVGIVIWIVLCPINSATVRMSTPAITSRLANVCRIQYQVKSAIRASATA